MFSEAGGFFVLVFASSLHIGQNDLHAVSHESTQPAWNSAEKFSNELSVKRELKN